MEEIVAALRELAHANQQFIVKLDEMNEKLVNKLDEMKQEVMNDREERIRKEEEKRKNYLEMDINFVMEWKNWSRRTAVEKLHKHKYDITRVVKGNLYSGNETYLDLVLSHYGHKSNRAVLENW